MSEKTEKAKIIRDHILPLIRMKGSVVDISGIKVLMWDAPPWKFIHRTPFSPVSQLKPSDYTEARLLQKRGGKLNLGYSLDIWRGKKLFNVEWDQPDKLSIVSFMRGDWEDEVLAMK